MTNDPNNPNQTHITAGGDRSVAIGPGAQQVVAVTGDHVTVIQSERDTILSPNVLARLTAAYLQAVEDRWTRLEADETRPPLDSVFFMLQAREREERRPLEPPPADLPPDSERRTATDAASAQPPKPPPPPMPLGEVLKKEPRLVILGEPGAGKTTALQFIALCFSSRKQGEKEAWHKERLGIEQPWIPILLTLQTRAEAIATRGTLFDVLAGEVRSFLPSCSEGEARALLRSWLAGDGLLVLLDGLDEVSASQGEVREKIARLRGENIRPVVTSRPAGFVALGDLKEYTLKPLGEQEAPGYVTGWLKALKECSAEEAREQAERLLDKMRARPSLRRLSDNPLLLRLSAEYYARTGDVVRNRAELYRAWIEEAWRRAEKRGADPKQKQTALTALEAMAWHRQAGGENTEEAFCCALQEHGVAAGQVEVESLLVLLREKVGLLVLDIERREGRDIRRYLFAHQTMREYLVVRRLVRAWEQNAKRTFRFLKPRLHLPEWREPLLLLAGLLPEGEAGRLVEWTRRARSPCERILKRDVFLAAEMAAASGRPLSAALLTALTMALRDEKVRVRWTAAEVLETIGNPQAALALTDALQDEDSNVHGAAARALVRIGPQATPALTAALQSENRFVREAAARALGEIADPQAVPALTAALRDEDEFTFVRCTAAEALVRIGPQAAPALISALRDKYSDVREAAAEALGKIGDPQTAPALTARLWDENPHVRQVAAEALVRIGPQALPVLTEALRDENEDLRAVAAEVLGKIGDPQAVPALTAALRDDNQRVHWATLREIEAAQATPVLLKALQDENKFVRRAAAEALGEIGDLQAAPALTSVLQDEDAALRWAAARALGKIGDPQAVRSLIAVLGDDDPFMRRTTEEALIRIGSQAAPALTMTLWDESEDVRRAAAWMLGEIGDPQAAEALTAALRDEDEVMRWVAAEALAKIGPQAIPALAAALRDEDSSVRQAAVELLGEIGDPQAVPVLTAALWDENKDVRRAGAWALGSIGDPQAAPVLTAALRDENENVRAAAARALGSIGGPQAVPALIKAIQDEKWLVRGEAAEALGNIGDPQALLALLAAPRDDAWFVRKATAEALTKLLMSSSTLSPETAAAVRRHVPTLIRTAVRQREYELLGRALQFQASWRVQQSPWQDPLLLPPRSPAVVRLQRVGLAIAGLLLAGALALLGVLIAGAGDVLKARLLLFLQPQPLVLVTGLLLLMAALIAGLEALRERWLKRPQR